MITETGNDDLSTKLLNYASCRVEERFIFRLSYLLHRFGPRIMSKSDREKMPKLSSAADLDSSTTTGKKTIQSDVAFHRSQGMYSLRV